MSVPMPVKYPLDYSGSSPNNLVSGETHQLDALTNRIIVPNYAPFFTESMKIVDTLTGRTLTPYTQWLAIQLEEEPTLEAGKEICSIIIIIDKAVSNNVQIQYQTLGGPLSYSVNAIIDLVNNLNLDNRTVAWGDIIGKPDRFPPTPHGHKLTDVYGWHKLFPELEAIAQAILTSDQAVLDQIRAQFQALIDSLKGQNDSLAAALQAHINDKANPHTTTKAQVGLSLVDNFATATVGADTNPASPSNAKFATPYIVAQMIQAIASAALTAHVNDKNNPHNTTAAQVGAYTTAQVNTLLAGYLPVGGTAVNSNLLQGNNVAQILAAAYNQVGSMGKRNVFISNAGPDGNQGVPGDIWLQWG